MWRAKEITPEDATSSRQAAERPGSTPAVHASYLINLGCSPGDLRESRKSPLSSTICRTL